MYFAHSTCLGMKHDWIHNGMVLTKECCILSDCMYSMFIYAIIIVSLFAVTHTVVSAY